MKHLAQCLGHGRCLTNTVDSFPIIVVTLLLLLLFYHWDRLGETKMSEVRSLPVRKTHIYTHI